MRIALFLSILTESYRKLNIILFFMSLEKGEKKNFPQSIQNEFYLKNMNYNISLHLDGKILV